MAHVADAMDRALPVRVAPQAQKPVDVAESRGPVNSPGRLRATRGDRIPPKVLETLMDKPAGDEPRETFTESSFVRPD